jgi:hypothetical protein
MERVYSRDRNGDRAAAVNRPTWAAVRARSVSLDDSASAQEARSRGLLLLLLLKWKSE